MSSIQARPVRNIMVSEFVEMLQSRIGLKGSTQMLRLDDDFGKYADDPVAFGRELLREEFTDDIVEMMYSFRDNPITIGKSANAVGKTHGAARCIVWFFCVFKQSQVYTAAAPPVSNLSRLLWGEIKAILEKNIHLFKKFSIGNGMWFSRAPQSFVTGVAIPQQGTPEQRKAKFSGKHAPALAFVFDEGDAIPSEVYEATESCMSGGHARLLVLFNPRHQAGTLYQMERKKMASVVKITAFTHPNVTSGENLIPGAVTREQTVRRINEWTRPLTPDEIRTLDLKDTSIFKVPDFLEGCTASSFGGDFTYPPLKGGYRIVDNPAFSYMVLGEYPSMSTYQLIDRKWIDRAVENWQAYVKHNGEMLTGNRHLRKAGLDVAEFGIDRNVLTIKDGNFIPRQRVWAGVDPVTTGDLAYSIMAENSVNEIAVDSTGVGAGVAPQIRRHGAIAHRIMTASGATDEAMLNEGTLFGQFGNMRDQGFWALREWLRLNEEACLPPDDELIEELLALEYHKDKREKVKITDSEALRGILKRSADKAHSIMQIFCDPGQDSSAEVYEEAYA